MCILHFALIIGSTVRQLFIFFPYRFSLLFVLIYFFFSCFFALSRFIPSLFCNLPSPSEKKSLPALSDKSVRIWIRSNIDIVSTLQKWMNGWMCLVAMPKSNARSEVLGDGTNKKQWKSIISVKKIDYIFVFNVRFRFVFFFSLLVCSSSQLVKRIDISFLRFVSIAIPSYRIVFCLSVFFSIYFAQEKKTILNKVLAIFQSKTYI